MLQTFAIPELKNFAAMTLVQQSQCFLDFKKRHVELQQYRQ